MVMTEWDSGHGQTVPPPSLLSFLVACLSMAGEGGGSNDGGGGSRQMVTVGEEGEVEEA
jgi:hypothetical protein